MSFASGAAGITPPSGNRPESRYLTHKVTVKWGEHRGEMQRWLGYETDPIDGRGRRVMPRAHPDFPGTFAFEARFVGKALDPETKKPREAEITVYFHTVVDFIAEIANGFSAARSEMDALRRAVEGIS